MAKETFQRTKPHVNVGTIGHIDHGKTTRPPRSAVQATKDSPRLSPTRKSLGRYRSRRYQDRYDRRRSR